MKIKTYITSASMLVMSVIGGYSQSVSAFSATGPLYVDTNYGVNGTALINLISDQDGDVYHISTGVAANNKVVTLTGVELFNTVGPVYALVSFDDQGNPDPGFGIGGQVILWNLQSNHHEAVDMIVQSDGKIVVVGYATRVIFGDFHVFAARYLADGSVDITFGNNGITQINYFFDVLGGPGGIHPAQQSNGNIILAGGTGNIKMAYLDSNGSIITSYFHDLPGTGRILDMEVDDQDRIVVVGSGNTKKNTRVISVARFTEDGLLDVNNFKPAGCTTDCGYALLDVYDTHPDLNSEKFIDQDYQMDVALKKPYGSGDYKKIVVSGSFGIVRLNEDGNEDTGFGINGRVQNDLQFVDSVTPGYNYVEIRSDGKIASLNNQSSTLALYRKDGQIALQCTGIESVDIPHNQAITPVFQSDYKNYSMKIDTKDRIVLAGAAIVPDDDFNMEHEAVFAERYRRHCHLIEDDDVDVSFDPYKKADPTTKMTIRDVHPFVHPQDIVGPEWKIRS